MNKKIYIIFISFLIGNFFFSGCTTTSKNTISSKEKTKINVVTTIFPLYEFARETGGESVNVTLILPPGTEPHFFEPTTRDIIKISEADIFISIGEEMEPWAHDILEGINNNNIATIEASNFVKLIKAEHLHEEHHGKEQYDPHIWLDFINDQKIIDAIKEQYISIDPENKKIYEQNSKNYKAQLTTLDNKYTNQLKACNQNTIITGGHNAYSYLANRYNLHFISAYGVSPNSEPTPQTMKNIVDISREHKIKYILFEELLSPRLAEAIAEETNTQNLMFTPATNITKTELNEGITFIQLMENNLSNLKIALECNK